MKQGCLGELKVKEAVADSFFFHFPFFALSLMDSFMLRLVKNVTNQEINCYNELWNPAPMVKPKFDRNASLNMFSFLFLIEIFFLLFVYLCSLNEVQIVKVAELLCQNQDAACSQPLYSSPISERTAFIAWSISQWLIECLLNGFFIFNYNPPSLSCGGEPTFTLWDNLKPYFRKLCICTIRIYNPTPCYCNNHKTAWIAA